ncbi:MAG: glutamate synthase large subunit [candidate division NC10 bacterium]|nr:glutamate synthase large subunit [candidate division NC10 bacterium]
MQDPGLPRPQGLYDPRQEHDACGVGFVVDIKGRKSRDIVVKALTILKNLLHRGACGCEANTGDGAGILLQIPDAFLRREAGRLGIALPPRLHYAVGMVCLPTEPDERVACQAMLDRIAREEGQVPLGWRDVPTNHGSIGESARRTEPIFRQVFIGRGGAIRDAAHFERTLYLIRKRVENGVLTSDLRQRRYFYVGSLSCKTIVYKGMLSADQIEIFFPDITDPAVESALALVHQRFSTNTFPTWSLAHPFRYLAHNGEINTLRGNINWMHARQALFESDLYGDRLRDLLPVIREGGSDSAMLDNALEMLVMCGRSLPHAIMMLIPEAWNKHEGMSPEKKAFYEYHSCLMEPWDGPASVSFTDGTVIGAVLDRNGLRPSRYCVTRDGLLILASEVGVLDIPPEDIVLKERLHPGRMLLVDTREGRIIDDAELKSTMAAERPYGEWLRRHLVHIDDLPAAVVHAPDHETVRRRQQLFGYTHEDLRILMAPMAMRGEEPVGSMGNDTSLAVLSDRPRMLYDYFKQLFAQVTNPPLDAIREELVTSMASTIGPERNLLRPEPESCHQIAIPGPILDNRQTAKLRHVASRGFRSITLPMLFPAKDGAAGMAKALERLCNKAAQAIERGYNILILSDRGVDLEQAPIPALLATAGLHHHLIRRGMRTKCGLLVETGEAREVHHCALLMGFGAGAINPYLAFETLDDMRKQGLLPEEMPAEQAIKNYVKALNKGMLKVMSKMGISTIQSYCGAQIFEAVGLSKEFVDAYFTWTATRVEGVGLDVIAEEVLRRHRRAFPSRLVRKPDLEWGGEYQWRQEGENHLFNPDTVFKLQHACRSGQYALFKEYSQLVNDQSRRLYTLRGLLELKPAARPVPLDEVEPVERIVRRFATGAMSYGSISQEAHETLAIAMNRLGGRSNTGEGGEDPTRFVREPNGDWRRSAVKQVASGRFGVTSEYLVNAEELQIKMAQGAKPGEGGQLPGHKVYPWIAKVRNSMPGVQLISPPPHHDIYSIEDLAQLIYDLKNANPEARISVKLVAEIGVGTVAAGVSKAHADVVLISGHDGGTGASPLTAIKHSGIPWELGLAETQQVLVLNKLRDRIVVQTDGQLKTGRDVVIAALLGAEEFGFATAPLVVMGCVMMRVCHLNTCPVGVATQDPELRRRFTGRPEHVETFFRFIAQEVREYMAQLGFRTVDEMIGRSDRLEMRKAIEHWKGKGLDFSKILYRPEVGPEVAVRRVVPQAHGLETALDHRLVELCRDALEHRKPVSLEMPIRNTNRTVGTILGYHLTKRHGGAGLPDDTIRIRFTGSAGQSFGAFVPRGITMVLEGDANDYFGKGLSGGRLIAFPPAAATFPAEENILVGNVVFYGATSGEAFLRGVAGERFCVRNSGVHAVVEGVGDHGCEYMTGGRVVVLGRTGRNFAAGMSGGIAYVLDESGDFERRCNREMVDLEPPAEEDVALIHSLIRKHSEYTRSSLAAKVLANWQSAVAKFVKIMPRDYRRVLAAQARAKAEGREPTWSELLGVTHG